MDSRRSPASKMATYTSQQRFSLPSEHVMQKMTIGCPMEIFPEETRVALTPAAAFELISNGHTVYIQTNAGFASGFNDDCYAKVGCTIIANAKDLYAKSQVITKVLEPQQQEYDYIQKNQIIFFFFAGTEFHSQQQPQTRAQRFEKQTQELRRLVEAAKKHHATLIPYQAIQTQLGCAPVTNAMSEIAGHLSIQQGMKYLEAQMGGCGVLIGQISNVQASHVLVLGGGVAAFQAAQLAANAGANVTLMDICTENLRAMRNQLPNNVDCLCWNKHNLEKMLPTANLVVGAAFSHELEAPLLITKEQMKLLHPGSVVVDLAMSQGGNFETSQATSWEKATFFWNNITHFCVPRITAATPRVSSMVLSNAALPYVLQVANKGWRQAAIDNFEIMQGVSLADGNLTTQWLAVALKLQYVPMEQLLEKDIHHLAQSTAQTPSLSPNVMSLKQQLDSIRQLNSNAHLVIEA